MVPPVLRGEEKEGMTEAAIEEARRQEHDPDTISVAG